MLHRLRIPLTLLTTAALLAGCGQSVTGTSSYVTVGNAWNDADALPNAAEWCAKFGKSARYRYMEKYRVTFDCVSAS